MKRVNQPPAESLSLEAAERIDAVCLLFEENWKAGQRPKPEEFLQDVPAEEQAALLRELLLLDVHYRKSLGETPTAADYEQRFPGHEELIRSLLSLEPLPGPLEPATPSPVPPIPQEQETGPFIPPGPTVSWAGKIKAQPARPEPQPRRQGAVAEMLAGSHAELQERVRTAEQNQQAERRRRRRTQFLLATVVLAALAVGSGVWWWQRQERTQRAAQLRDGCASVLTRTTAAIRQGRLAEAEGLLASSKRLFQEDPASLEELRQLEADLDLLLALDRVRNDLGPAEEPDAAAAAAEYRKAFEARGLFGEGGDPQERARRIGQSSGSALIVAALDDWAAREKDEAVRRDVLALLREADPSAEAANQLRAPAIRGDRKRLERLAASGAVETLSPAQALWLSRWLQASGGDGTTVLRRAQRAHPLDFGINLALARSLQATKPEEGLGYARAAVTARPASAVAHHCLGDLLAQTQDLEGAVEELRQAVQLDPEKAAFLFSLGKALLDLGRFEEAKAAAERCHALLADQHPLRLQAAQQRAECNRLASFEKRLAVTLQETPKPTDTTDCLALARIYQAQKRFVEAARLYSRALAAQPTLAADLTVRLRSQAAGCAARAGAGEGRDAAGLAEAERGRWRQQALTWLQADLSLARKTYDDRNLTQHRPLRRILAGWLSDPQLAGVREESALGKLPEAEREGWRRFWDLVRALVEQLLSGQWGRWRIEGTELVQEATEREALLLFGDANWADCTIELEAQPLRGSEIGVVVRAASLDEFTLATVGGWGNSLHGVQVRSAGQNLNRIANQGSTQPGRWYRIKVVLQGKACSLYLDGIQVARHDELPQAAGRLGLRNYNNAARFRNVRVTDPQGKVLFAACRHRRRSPHACSLPGRPRRSGRSRSNHRARPSWHAGPALRMPCATKTFRSTCWRGWGRAIRSRRQPSWWRSWGARVGSGCWENPRSWIGVPTASCWRRLLATLCSCSMEKPAGFFGPFPRPMNRLKQRQGLPVSPSAQMANF